MSMHIGIQLLAPQGFEVLRKDRTYYFVKSDAVRDRVLLLHFEERARRDTVKAKRKKKWTPHPWPVVVFMSRARFEYALLNKLIVRSEAQSQLPPWLGDLTTSQLTVSDQGRESAAKQHSERMDHILWHLWPLVESIEDVLTADDPDKVINRHARNCTPPQNETRMRVWFYAYVCFGRNRLALHYPIHQIGNWDRLEKPGQKFGRKSLVNGADHGYGSNDPVVIEKCIDGYRRFAGPGIHMAKIYQRSMSEIFGCVTKRAANGERHFLHPQGLAFPTFGQFAYQVGKIFSIEERRLTKYGRARTRNRMMPSMGRFAESVGCLMQRTEEDAYWVKEVSQGYLQGSHLPALIVVRVRCAASGMLVGIGFSLGSETGSAYRMAQFCMAIDKVRFCALFGWELDAEDWPCIGLSPYRVTDRGPGSTKQGDSRTHQGVAAIKEITQTHMGQSKAHIESSNPRAIKLEGQPSFVITKMTIPQLALKEIVRTIESNLTSDAGDRLNNDAIALEVSPTPLAIWNHLDARGRNDAIPMCFDDAVRAFLDTVTVVARLDGVYLASSRFDSPALRASGALDRVPANGRYELKAYMLSVCLRHLWVEVNDTLVEVDAMLSIRDGDEQMYLSYPEFEQLVHLRQAMASQSRAAKHATKVSLHQQYKDTTGVAFDQGSRRPGRAKRGTATSREEARQLKEVLKPGRSAR